MNNQWFSGCTSPGEVKAQYRQLALEHHPDKNPGEDTTKVMQEINAAYHKILKYLTGYSGKTEQGKSYTYTYRYDTEEEIRQQLATILAADLPDGHVYLIGYWIWIRFPGKPAKAIRDTLKGELNCTWHSKRKAWYWRPDWSQSTYNSRTTLSGLAMKYGYKEYETKGMDAEDEEEKQTSITTS